MNVEWRRVTKANPCQVCGRPSWCTVSEIGWGCMRVSSDKPMRNGGWLHSLGGRSIKLPPREPPKPKINCTEIMRELWRSTTDMQRARLAETLGVSVVAIRCVGACWYQEYHAWAFPMVNANRSIVGIRLRNDAGRKWAVTGSSQGIFFPTGTIPQATAYVTEGPTDLAAALTLGLFAIGRPSCSGAVADTVTAIKRSGCTRAVLLADNDGPGTAGARMLAKQLDIPSCITVLPTKDVRAFLNEGGTASLLESLTNSLVWIQPT